MITLEQLQMIEDTLGHIHDDMENESMKLLNKYGSKLNDIHGILCTEIALETPGGRFWQTINHIRRDENNIYGPMTDELVDAINAYPDQDTLDAMADGAENFDHENSIETTMERLLNKMSFFTTMKPLVGLLEAQLLMERKEPPTPK